MTGAPNARGRRTIAAIETAALDAAGEVAYDQITVHQICARARVSERVFFNHFLTKEDAFIGRDVPSIDEGRARGLIAEPSGPLMTGAARLVILPEIPEEIANRRRALVAATPALLARAHETLTPVRERCLEIVCEALRTRFPSWSKEQRDGVARVVVAGAAELLVAPESVLDALSEARTALA
jgi:AcrR family transcriptional regulator